MTSSKELSINCTSSALTAGWSFLIATDRVRGFHLWLARTAHLSKSLRLFVSARSGKIIVHFLRGDLFLIHWLQLNKYYSDFMNILHAVSCLMSESKTSCILILRFPTMFTVLCILTICSLGIRIESCILYVYKTFRKFFLTHTYHKMNVWMYWVVLQFFYVYNNSKSFKIIILILVNF